MYTFGFIGCGNMGAALARATSLAISPNLIFLSNRTEEKAINLAKELSCNVSNNQEIAEKCDYIYLGVKPHLLGKVLADLAPSFAKRTTPFVLISMVAGVSISEIKEMAQGDYPVIRTLPNTPCSVGKGIIFYNGGELNDEQLNPFINSMSKAGSLIQLEEELMNAGSSIAGCGPAFVAMFVEALADGGVHAGISRPMAIKVAAEMMIGTGHLILETGKHPGEIKDNVCSPGGTTIRGVEALEENGFRNAVIQGVLATLR